MKPQFDINKYTDPLYVMVCRSEQEAIVFTRFLDSVGRTWRGGGSYIAKHYYDGKIWDEIAYFFNQGMYGGYRTIRDARERGLALYYDNFSWGDADEGNNIETESWEEFVSSFVLA